MASGPFQPIPETTQVHTDRLVGAKLGDVEVGARVCEGRFGTIYRARRRGGEEATLEVLRTEILGDDHEVRATNAINCAGIAEVFEFGQVPDGRRYRVMELLEGESLDQLLQRCGRLGAPEVAVLLGRVAEVLKAAHAWALPHGSLGPSSVFVVKDAVKLIDFGLEKRRASQAEDLKQLGELGFTLLTGEEVEVRPPPSPGSIPEPLELLLRGLAEGRFKDAVAAQEQLLRIEPLLAASAPPLPLPLPPPRPAPARRRAGAVAWIALAAVVAGGGAAAFTFWPRAPEPPPTVAAEPGESLAAEGAAVETSQTDEQPLPAQAPSELRPQASIGPRRTAAAPAPSAAALQEEISRLESRLRRQVSSGDDVEQALFVLNKQRLRLTGSPTEQDRKDVAQQLAGWRRSYLRR